MISVIIPVFNDEIYFRDCLDSVCRQSFSDIEIIVVDDGSTDNSGVIADEYATNDDKVTVIHKVNSGLVDSRKVGVNASKGDFITFVDSDDWIDVDTIEVMNKLQQDSGSDIVACGIYRQYEDKKVEVINTIPEGTYDKAELIERVYPYMLFNGYFYQMGVRPNLVNKLVRKDLLVAAQEYLPNEITNGEDAAATYNMLLHANRVCLTNRIFYHYRQRSGNMSKAIANSEDIKRVKILSSYLQESLCRDYTKIMAPQVRAYIANVMVQRCIGEFDIGTKQILRSFGGIDAGARIAIYGAGNFGYQVHEYAVKMGLSCVWLDKQYEHYQSDGFDVLEPQRVLDKDIDLVLIAVIDEKVASVIQNELISMGVKKEKLRWLDLEWCYGRQIQ